VNLAAWYLWIKALHIVAVMSWMAGLLYLPRLFVYHCETVPASGESERFKVMERRLLRAIMTPAMVVAWVLGITLAFTLGAWDDGWLHAKLLLVLLLSALHGAFARWQKDFALDRNRRSQRFYRFANEVPALFMLVIVILAVVKPF
jgi:putative membrane protein